MLTKSIRSKPYIINDFVFCPILFLTRIVFRVAAYGLCLNVSKRSYRLTLSDGPTVENIVLWLSVYMYHGAKSWENPNNNETGPPYRCHRLPQPQGCDAIRKNGEQKCVRIHKFYASDSIVYCFHEPFRWYSSHVLVGVRETSWAYLGAHALKIGTFLLGDNRNRIQITSRQGRWIPTYINVLI